MNKLLVALLATALPFVLGSALADDKTPSIETKKADSSSDPYGGTPVRTPKGTPLVGDFDPRMTPEEKAAAKKAKRAEKMKALSTTEKRPPQSKPDSTLEGGFGPLGGWPEQKARRDALEKERAAKKRTEKGSGQ